jgi:hypothetical protein
MIDAKDHPLVKAMETMGREERAAYAWEMMGRIARELARRNPDAAEMFGDALSHSAREEKADHIHGLGVATGISLFTGRLEMRAGELDRYIDGKPAGDGYEEVVIPLPLDDWVTG